ncbi:type II secretion system F family protein [Goodfellowiella coeruleoviolacea]|uniref:Type II secretion system (T2SS), protein F n=1 Tax=Goodfellowiella coeruleoviolacea TaxID=334858 RepID=A0AAE3KDX4_9PSEU|nr:type II secretion system F family protein [Goodfellowiella coeruleoviolacea]MCP2164631.1 Type II secretion system (T2SS), protein F [Goodfellowiella coeruleoviolacea]
MNHHSLAALLVAVAVLLAPGPAPARARVVRLTTPTRSAATRAHWRPFRLAVGPVVGTAVVLALSGRWVGTATALVAGGLLLAVLGALASRSAGAPPSGPPGGAEPRPGLPWSADSPGAGRLPGQLGWRGRPGRLGQLGRFGWFGPFGRVGAAGPPRPARRSATDPHLATCWELLAACLRAGLAVPTAVRAVAEAVPGPAGQVLRRVADLMALGADPVRAWTPALAHPDTAPLARGARRSARSGAALAGVAAELAERVRGQAADQAEARAQRTAVWVTGPLGLCFLPAFLCLGVLPVVVGLAGEALTAG